MKISVVIADQLPGPGLAEALAGVAAQTHADWDVLVAEYGPGAGTDHALSEFAARHVQVRYEHVDEEGVPAAARNRLLDLATGDAVAFLEPHDAWLPRHLANAVQQLAAGADVVVSNVRIQGSKTGRAASEVSVPAQLASDPVRALFARDAIPSASCVVLRQSVASLAGRFDPRFHGGETRDYWLRCALDGARFALTERTTCRCDRPGETASERALHAAEQTVTFYEKHRDLSAVPAALRRRLLAGALVSHGRLLRAVDPGRAARCFMRAWSLQPVHVQTLGQFALTEWHTNPPDPTPDVP